MTHGYPDSFFRFHKLVPLLADPGSHGADPEDSFDVVVPSLPGYGFSETRTEGGGIFGVGDLWHRLMTKELGYSRFGAHGGDWGSTVTEQLGRSHPRSVIGIHLTDVPFWHIFQKPKELSAAEEKYFERNARWQREDGAYAMIQGTRPRTAAAALRDSPIGLAAWLVEKFQEWSDCGDDLDRSFTKDELLTNVMLYWVTGTIESSFQPYRDVVTAGAARWMTEAAKKLLGSDATPAGFALFPKDISTPPREWGERFFNVQRWTELPRGGHFAAMEEPQRLAEEIRAFFRPLRRLL
ncbi:MAG TPA: alpha/beta fold hydrolase [Myxococcaceae bacterium]